MIMISTLEISVNTEIRTEMAMIWQINWPVNTASSHRLDTWLEYASHHRMMQDKETVTLCLSAQNNRVAG